MSPDGEEAPRDPKRLLAAGRASGHDDAWAASGLVISGIAVWGGLGWLASHWSGAPVFTMLGLLLGMGGGLFLVWYRYGRA